MNGETNILTSKLEWRKPEFGHSVETLIDSHLSGLAVSIQALWSPHAGSQRLHKLNKTDQ